MKKAHLTTELSSATIKAGHRIYFVDAKADSQGNRFLSISEIKSNQGEEGKRDRQRIHIYEEDIPKFIDALSKALSAIAEDRQSEPSIQLPELENLITLD